MPIELSTEALQEPVASCGTAISCLVRLSAENGGEAENEAPHRHTDLQGETLPLSCLVKLAAEFGLHAERIQVDWQGLKATGFAHPLLILRKNTDVVIVTGGGRSGAEEVSVWDPHHDGVVFFVPREDFERAWDGHALVITPESQGAQILELQLGRKAMSDPDDDTSPAPLDIAEHQTRPSPVRIARASILHRDTGTPRHLLSRRLCFTGIVILATASIGVFLLRYSDADHVAATSTAAPSNSPTPPSTPANREEASPSAGAVATASVAPEGALTLATPIPAEPADSSTPIAGPPLVAPKPGATPAAPPVAAAPSVATAPAAQLPEATLSVATSGPATASTGAPLSAAEIGALVARGDVLFSKGDLAAARLFYEHAADAGDGQAAVRLGESFDPVFLDDAHLPGVRGDPRTALSWYRRARDLGAADADILIKSLEAK